MIQLRTDCLVFETASGDTIPCSARAMNVEVLGHAAVHLDPETVRQAALATLHYFRTERRRTAVTLEEFTAAIELVLHKFGLPMATYENDGVTMEAHFPNSRVRKKKIEMMFFCVVRDHIHARLRGSERVIHLKGLRDSIQGMFGTGKRNQVQSALGDHVVDFLRDLVAHRTPEARLTLVIV